MGEGEFPKSVADAMATITDVFRYQGRIDVVELLENANARFDRTEFDNWNGGTSTWALRLEVPVSVFASAEPRLSDIERDIAAKIRHLIRDCPNDNIGEVTISPLPPGALTLGRTMTPSEMEIRRLWRERRFRLFLSHVSCHKVAVSKLKDELSQR